MKRETIEKKVIILFKRELGRKDVEISNTFEDLDIDSLDRDSVECLCEDLFDFAERIAVWDEFWRTGKTLNDLCNFIEARI